MNITEFLKNNGIVKNKQQANLLMIAIIIISLVGIFALRKNNDKYGFDETLLTPEEREFIGLE